MPVQGILNIIIRKVLYTHRMVHKPLTVVPVERKRKGKEKTINNRSQFNYTQTYEELSMVEC